MTVNYLKIRDHKRDVIGTLKHPFTCSEELRLLGGAWVAQ